MVRKTTAQQSSDFSPELLTAVLDSIHDGVVTFDKSRKITSFNRSAEKILGVSRKDAIGLRCCDVVRSSICQFNCAFEETLKTGRPTISSAAYVENSKGEKAPVSICTSILKDGEGNAMGGVETIRDLSLVAALRKKISGRYSFSDIISKNHKMEHIFGILPEVARSDSTVIIEGESGTGKSLMAKAIHNLSFRKDKSLVVVHCGALPDSLLESELFGYKAGAFTDAKKDKPGKFALAEGGTIFFDEIGDVSPALQVRLLRILQDKTYEPLGGTQTQTANVRVVAATHKNLKSLVEKGLFREDLYYRVNVIRIGLPPLRERREDIPLLVEHYVAHLNRIKEKEISGISARAMAILLNYDYPGNIRELENVIEHAFVITTSGMIRTSHLPENLQPSVLESRSPTGPTGILDLRERKSILESLERNQWNRVAAAEELGIHRSTLLRKIKALNLEVPQVDGRNRKK